MKNEFPIRKLLLLVIAQVYFWGILPAQQKKDSRDSLLIVQALSKADQYFDKQQYDSAFLTAEAAARIASSTKMYNAHGWTLIRMAEVLVEQRKIVQADELATKALKISQQVKDTLMNGVALLLLGQVKMYNDQPDDAILLIDKSIMGGLGKYPNEYLALAYNDLGYAWGLKDEYERQAQFTHKAFSIYEMIKSDAGIGMSLGNLSTIYYQLGQKDKAIEYGKQSLIYREKVGDIIRLGITSCNLSQYYLGVNLDSSIKYQELCVKYAKISGDEGRVIQSYITSSLVANARKNNKEAFDYEQKVIEMLEKSGANNRMLSRRYIAAAIYTDILKYDTSVTVSYYKKSLNLSSLMGDRANLRDVHLFLSNFHKKNKNFTDAYTAYVKYILYRDSLINMEKEEKIAELETRYETNLKDNEISRLNNEQKIKQLEIEKQMAIIAGNNAVTIQKQNEIDLLSQSKELQEARIKHQEEELVKKELIATANKQQLELADAEKKLQEKTISNQRTLRNLLLAGLGLFFLLGYAYFNRYQLKKKLEQQNSLLAMRNNISQDLHDDIGASLSNINILNELARRNIGHPEKSTAYLSKASEDIQHISESLSDIVWNINPKYDEMQNLFIRMKRYAADMLDGKNIKGNFDFPANENSVQLSMAQRRDLYLVFKEAINNLVKYSCANEAFISINASSHQVKMEIRDNGKGFDDKLIKQGNGLHNMKQRAAVSGGTVTINSAPGKGTAVTMLLVVA